MRNRIHNITISLFLLIAAVATPVVAPTWLAQALHRNDASAIDTLISNGGFESGAFGDWIACGGATLIDAQAPGNAGLTRNGRYAVRLGQPIDSSCGNDALGPSQVLAEDVTIPSDASDVTLSLWYRVTGDWAAGEVNIAFGKQPLSYLGNTIFVTTMETDEMLPGWHLFRQNVKASDLAALRGQTVYLQIYTRFQGQPGWNWNMVLDDVRVTPARERTGAVARPGDLNGDGARPILISGPGSAAGRHGLYRIDTDGGNRTRIADITLPSLQQPTWSPNGQKIAFITDWLEPESNTDTTRFQAQIARAYVINADGSNLQPMFRTSGMAGTKESPPGCLRTNTCTDRGISALDMLLTNIEWSPDNATILGSICVRQRWYNSDKSTGDASCHLSTHTVASPNAPLPIVGLNAYFNEATDASWAPNGRILFNTGPSLTQRAKGVWELNISAQPSQTTQLVTWLTASGSSPDLRPNGDTLPVWAPDGRYFVTYRLSRSVHFAPINDIVGGLRSNYGIVIHDRQNLGAPREVLLVDHGTLTGRPTWSPDGRYILYTLQSDDGLRYDIWWVDTSSGDTGPVTNDGKSLNADWLPTHARGQSGPVSTPNPSQTRRVYLPITIRPGNPPAPIGVPVVFPTVTPAPQPTALPTPVNPTAVPPRGISGRMTYNGAPASGVNVQLEKCLNGICDVVQRVTTNANGEYAFQYVPPYVFGYYVTYRNGSAGGNSDDARFLDAWQTDVIAGTGYAERVSVPAFDIADVVLTGPGDNATVSVPSTFSWNSRSGGEAYGWDFSGNTFNLCNQTPAVGATSFTLESLDCQFPSIGTGTPYVWWVRITRSGANGGIGESRRRTVTFSP